VPRAQQLVPELFVLLRPLVRLPIALDEVGGGGEHLHVGVLRARAT
jgi:hypothetical protein